MCLSLFIHIHSMSKGINEVLFVVEFIYTYTFYVKRLHTFHIILASKLIWPNFTSFSIYTEVFIYRVEGESM
jgi:hypothetical protein